MIYLVKSKFIANYWNDFNLDRKILDIRTYAIQKIIVFRNFILHQHKQKSLKDNWDEDRIPWDVLQDIKENEAKQKRKLTNKQKRSSSPSRSPSVSKYSQSRPKSFFSQWIGENKKLKSFSQREKSASLQLEEQFDPHNITIKQSSEFIAQGSVQYYEQTISEVLEYMGALDTEADVDICEETLYNNPMNSAWCYDQLRGMCYFTGVSIFVLAAPGQQTQSEKEFKYLKHWVTPERNLLGSKSLKAITNIHSKVLEDDLNWIENTKASKNEIACLLLLKVFGLCKVWYIKETFDRLKERVISKGYDLRKIQSMIIHSYLYFVFKI